ncbi:MAG: nucleotidyltransferase family protein [Theionarchaea archaeon]|nr:nucleotidyltransferase family protein [Theionarchaea archaeon]
MAEEAIRIVNKATQQGIRLRLLGGLAIRLHCTVLDFCEREYSDIDLIGLNKEKQKIISLFTTLGYIPDIPFNTLHGYKRLKFEDQENDRHVDVFLDHFDMDHDWDLSHRLGIEQYTLPLSDLLLTKLQICKINEKDIRDIITILKDSSIGEEDSPNIINIEYMAELCSRDWELFVSVLDSLRTTMTFVEDLPLEDDEKSLVQGRIRLLTRQLIDHPKTAQWKLRSAVGKHLKWCQEVEQ